MRKKILVVLFLLLCSLPWNSVFWEQINTQTTKVDKNISQIKTINRKTLKNEIKKRKKYHRYLLEEYNKSFEEKFLPLIQENSLILTEMIKTKNGKI